MFADMGRWQQRLEPAMTELSSLEPELQRGCQRTRVRQVKPG
ncbi:hypothetical protein D187_002738 [Cystobacter fuscus DSM 2262]|uniref:Uncharacterized protein n=1 Tax=Cystobacter fuscus (strain ATCC 25194 / DSM 2262 / NBRC 100088 / M29) TaxID=1242864 RepID=S9PBE0_CYSF2|nr:hypothetical protein D187_002738 [Cystobacter fuscus DSM 2262]